jgi:hypothetical protein
VRVLGRAATDSTVRTQARPAAATRVSWSSARAAARACMLHRPVSAKADARGNMEGWCCEILTPVLPERTCWRSDLVPYSFSISYTMMQLRARWRAYEPRRNASQTITLLGRHVSRGDLLSLAFGQYPLSRLFHLRLRLPSTTVKKYNTFHLTKKKKKKRRYLASSLSYLA